MVVNSSSALVRSSNAIASQVPRMSRTIAACSAGPYSGNSACVLRLRGDAIEPHVLFGERADGLAPGWLRRAGASPRYECPSARPEHAARRLVEQRLVRQAVPDQERQPRRHLVAREAKRPARVGAPSSGGTGSSASVKSATVAQRAPSIGAAEFGRSAFVATRHQPVDLGRVERAAPGALRPASR